MKFVTSILFLLLVPAIGQEDSQEPPQQLPKVIDSLASSDIKERCGAQVELDSALSRNAEQDLKQILSSYFQTTDPEQRQRLETSLEQAFYAKNYHQKLGFLGISIGRGILLKGDEQIAVVMATEVIPGSPANAAGVELGDHLLAIDGVSVSGPTCEDTMREKIAAKGAGTSCQFKIQRGDEVFLKEVVLGERANFVPVEQDTLRQPTKGEKKEQFAKWLESQKRSYTTHQAQLDQFQPTLTFAVPKMIVLRKLGRR